MQRYSAATGIISRVNVTTSVKTATACQPDRTVCVCAATLDGGGAALPSVKV